MTLRLETVSKTEGETLLVDEVSLSLEPGRLYVLFGARNAGKTTLLRLIAGLDWPSAGKILLDDVPIHKLDLRRRHLALIFPEIVNYPGQSVADNIAGPLRLQGVAETEAAERVGAMARLLGLEDSLESLPESLSLSLQQRCALARALVREPELLLLDEPLLLLDPKARRALQGELRALFAAPTGIILYATADPEEAMALGGRILILHEGRIVQEGTGPEIYRRPRSSRVAEAFAEPPMNIIDITIRGGVATNTAGFRLPLTGHLAGVPDARARLGLRPHQLSFWRSRENEVELAATVEDSAFTGADTLVRVNLHHAHWVVQLPGVVDVTAGMTVPLFFDPNDLYLFADTGALEVAPAKPVRAA